MNRLSSRLQLWKTSTNMIFWGVLVLTLFGWFASLTESIYSVLSIVFDTAQNFSDMVREYSGYQNEKLSSAIGYYHNVGTAMRVFEIITIAGWVFYVIGLAKFKNSQISERGRWLTGKLNTACWLGISGIFCYFIAGFLGWFGFLFRFVGWILNLISLFMFSGSFSKLSREKTWNQHARQGAKNLNTSYTFAIILQFLPIIIGLVVLFVGIGIIGELPNIISEFFN